MSKKRVLIVIGLVLTLLSALALCSCGSGSSSGSKTPDRQGDSTKWKNTDEFVKLDVCSKFLASFTTMAKDLSKDELDKGNKTLGLDAKAVVDINGNDFWLTLKVKYNYKDKGNSMMSLELTDEDVESSKYTLDDLIFGAYLYREMLYVAFGSTKFSLDLKTEVWNKIFPFDYKDSGSSAIYKSPAGILATVLVLKEDDFVQKKREVGTTTEYRFVLDIDTAGTLKRVVDMLDGTIGKDTSDPESLSALDEIFGSVLGITVEDIKAGDIPESSLKLDFTTTKANKISALKATLDVSSSDNEKTIFNGKKFKVDVDLKKFEIKTFNDVSFPFVNADNAAERENYFYFLDKTFRLQCAEERLLPDGSSEEYTISVTAKIYQEERINNYAFLEYRNKDGELLLAGAVYRDRAYIFKNIDGNLVCTVSFPLDISDIAEKVFSNGFERVEIDEEGNETVVKSEFSWLPAIGYVLGSMRIDEEDIKFFIDPDFFSVIWYNFNDALAYLNAQYEVDLYEDVAPIKEFKEFVVNSEFMVTLPYDRPFLLLINDRDEQLVESINRLKNAEPEITLTPIGSEEEGEVPEE